MVETWEYQYLNLISEILDRGEDRIDRTGVGTRALFGKHLDIDLTTGFPLLTTKKMAWKMIISELLWFIEGSGDERRLAEIHHGTRDALKTTIWTDNANASYWKPKAKFEGDLGRVYGTQWRSWQTYKANGDYFILDVPVDQLALAINKIKNNPTDRRIMVSAWNVGELDKMALPPCHYGFQFYVSNDKKLSCSVNLRSQDILLGTPFNIASYAILTHMIAQVTDCAVGRLIMNMGDCHIYSDHVIGAKTQLERTPFPTPKLGINPLCLNIDDFQLSDFHVDNYECHEKIALKMAV